MIFSKNYGEESKISKFEFAAEEIGWGGAEPKTFVAFRMEAVGKDGEPRHVALA
jgi:hypothetical protein